MPKQFFLPAVIAGFSATLLVLSQVPVPAADAAKTIEIVLNDSGEFVFSDTDAKISAGQSITWVAEGEVPHELVPDSAEDAFVDTLAFDGSNPPTQRFTAPGTVNYHCSIHPKSMRGTIEVAAAEAPAKKPATAPKPKPTPSYGY